MEISFLVLDKILLSKNFILSLLQDEQLIGRELESVNKDHSKQLLAKNYALPI